MTTEQEQQQEHNKIEENNKIEKNKSTLEQLIKANEQIEDLKAQLQNREARLMAMQELLNQVFAEAEILSNKLYKDTSSLLSQLSNITENVVKSNLQNELMRIVNLDAQTQKQLCTKYRAQELLPPLDSIITTTTTSTSTSTNNNNNNAKKEASK